MKGIIAFWLLSALTACAHTELRAPCQASQALAALPSPCGPATPLNVAAATRAATGARP